MEKTFADLLQTVELQPKDVKLLRHASDGLTLYQRGMDWFESYIREQPAATSPYKTNPKFAAHFLPGQSTDDGLATALFVGITELSNKRTWASDPVPLLWLESIGREPDEETEIVDLEWLDVLNNEREALSIVWGDAPRAWHQWAHKSPKPILQMVDGSQIDSIIAKGVLTDEQREEATRDYERGEIKRALKRNPELIDRLYRETVVEARPNQSAFRLSLLKLYSGKCIATDCDVPEALEAAHIVPFSSGSSARDIPSNGLLLRRDLHRLFDMHLLSIDPATSTIWLHSSLDDTSYGYLRGTPVEHFAAIEALHSHFSECSAKLK